MYFETIALKSTRTINCYIYSRVNRNKSRLPAAQLPNYRSEVAAPQGAAALRVKVSPGIGKLTF